MPGNICVLLTCLRCLYLCTLSAGEPLLPHPLADLAALAETAGAGHSDVAGTLTATYPDVFRDDLGRKVCVRYPNGGERIWLRVLLRL